jgi:tRNA 2-thiocytidine biosynthesis protein TtcA
MGAHDKSAFEVNKLSKRLHRLTGQAIIDFNMIEEGDRVMVCMSGGKDRPLPSHPLQSYKNR